MMHNFNLPASGGSIGGYGGYRPPTELKFEIGIMLFHSDVFAKA